MTVDVPMSFKLAEYILHVNCLPKIRYHVYQHRCETHLQMGQRHLERYISYETNEP